MPTTARVTFFHFFIPVPLRCRVGTGAAASTHVGPLVFPSSNSLISAMEGSSHSSALRKRVNFSLRGRLLLCARRLANFSAYVRACLPAPIAYTLFEPQKFRQHLCR